jgi:hypothetical protein
MVSGNARRIGKKEKSKATTLKNRGLGTRFGLGFIVRATRPLTEFAVNGQLFYDIDCVLQLRANSPLHLRLRGLGYQSHYH